MVICDVQHAGIFKWKPFAQVTEQKDIPGCFTKPKFKKR